jgi:Putative adhesin
MTERCPSCGAGLFEGQQFCRQCGATVAGLAPRDEATTRLLGDASQSQPAQGTSPVRGGTEPVGRQQSAPVYQEPPAYQEPTGFQKTAAFQQQTAYHPPLASFQQTSPLAPPARKGRGGLWLVALLAVFLLGAGVAGAGGYLWWRARHQQVVFKKAGPDVDPAAIPQPPLPPDFGEKLGEQIRRAVEGAGVAPLLDESGAVVTGDSTVLTKTYQIDEGATFSVRAVNGSVTITGTDGDEAEVKITKRGGSAGQRSAARVMLAQSEDGLAFISAPAPGVEVAYEVKLPRGQHAVEVATDKGDVKVSDFDGSISTDVKLGKIEFRDVTGQVRSNVIKGDTRVVYTRPEREGSQEFSVVKGDIEATLAEGTDAEVRAETTAGDISADDSLGLAVEKRPAGRALSGRLGDGGRTLRFKVTNGDIKLRK